jgi:2-polyprenyl-3-methyl-5-hydroxy-6-metoxy-1,4-benzoquinol methylase
MAYKYREYWSNLHQQQGGTLSSVGYQALGEGFNRVAYGRRRRALSVLLDRISLPDGAVCLEGACGVGAYAETWKARGVRRWFGVDISVDAIAKLQRLYPKHRFASVDLAAPSWGEIEQDLGEATCDLVTGIDVLYHLVEDGAFEAALRNLGRFVRPRGWLIVSDVFSQQATSVATHVRRRPLAIYAAVLAPLGFELVAREPVFGVMGDPVRGGGVMSGAIFEMWRICQKAVRVSPQRFRNVVGATIATLMLPLDAAIRGAGLAGGRNLELAVFQRNSRAKNERPDLKQEEGQA